MKNVFRKGEFIFIKYKSNFFTRNVSREVISSLGFISQKTRACIATSKFAFLNGAIKQSTIPKIKKTKISRNSETVCFEIYYLP